MDLYPYLPDIIEMSPSISIALVYLGLTVCISVFMTFDSNVGIERLLTMFILTTAIFGISLSIGEALENELNTVISIHSISIHEEFLVALCVEMIGALIFVLPIYGTDQFPQHIFVSAIISLIFLAVFFIAPIGDLLQILLTLRPGILFNYISNLQVELLSIIILFFGYSIIRIVGLRHQETKVKHTRQLIIMLIVIVGFVIVFQDNLLVSEYENISVAIGAATLSIFVITLAKINDTLLFIVICTTMILSVILLIGTRIPDFSLDPSTSINLNAELIGAITVALILDND